MDACQYKVMRLINGRGVSTGTLDHMGPLPASSFPAALLSPPGAQSPAAPLSRSTRR